MVHSSGNGLFYGALVAGAAGLAYVLFGPNQSLRSKRNQHKGTVSGLINYGNQCFVNAVLQSLAACNSMMDWLNYSINNSDAISKPRLKPEREKTACVTASLLQTLKKLNAAEEHFDTTLSPVHVLKALEVHRFSIPNEEQDAHELFNVLTSTLESEFYSSLPMYSLTDALLVKDMLESPSSPPEKTFFPGISSRSSVDFGTRGPRIPKSLPTRGLLASQLLCVSCGHKYPVRLDMFDSVSLAMPTVARGGPILLQDCLGKYVTSELIHEVNCEGCSTSGTSVATLAKKLTFAKLPSLLCFHIQRLVWLPNGIAMKRFEHVAFHENLNMDSYTYLGRQHEKGLSRLSIDKNLGLLGGKNLEGQTVIETSTSAPNLTNISGYAHPLSVKYRYRLSAVIEHLGNSHSGHFVTYRRGTGLEDSNWFYTSDSTVRRTSLKEVMGCSAYMVFYERLKESGN